MKKFILAVIIFFTYSYSQYITGDQISDITFTDSNVDSLNNIIYSSKSTKELISSGKVIVISFFNPG